MPEDGKKVAIVSGLAVAGIGAVLLLRKKKPSTPPPPPPGRANLYGKVTNAATGQAIPGVLITLGVLQTSSDSGGNYTFLDLEPVIFVITTTKDGYEPLSNLVTLTEGNNEFYIQMVPLDGIIVSPGNPIVVELPAQVMSGEIFNITAWAWLETKENTTYGFSAMLPLQWRGEGYPSWRFLSPEWIGIIWVGYAQPLDYTGQYIVSGTMRAVDRYGNLAPGIYQVTSICKEHRIIPGDPIKYTEVRTVWNKAVGIIEVI